MATATPELDHLGALHGLAQHVKVLERHGTAVDRSLRAKIRWERRWEAALRQMWPALPDDKVLNGLISAALKDWKRVPEKADVEKAILRTVVHFFSTLAKKLRAVFASPNKSGALAVYMTLAEDTSEDSGQHTLDALGLHQTWKWTGVRDMARDQFSVRGSKIIQNMYGRHTDQLRDIIIQATDPAHPRTQAQTRQEIKDRWKRLETYQVSRIARTETASVWETMNYNAQRANGVESFSWVVAHGPSIGPPKSLPVCPICLEKAAKGPYAPGEIELPPAHPNCRCTLVPDLARNWLPPARTWSGGPNPPLPLVQAPVP